MTSRERRASRAAWLAHRDMLKAGDDLHESRLRAGLTLEEVGTAIGVSPSTVWRDDGVVMEFIGDADAAAPRLAQAQLSADEVGSAWEQLLASLRALTAAGLVHADLSAYNLLWWGSRVVIIDLPQAVEFTTNADAPELLHRDLANVAGWFERRGLAVDVEGLFGDLIGLAW